MLVESPGCTTLHLILFIPRIKLMEGVEHGLADFDEGRAETHRAPISKRPNRNTAPVAFSHLVRCKEFAIWHYRLLRQHDQGRVAAFELIIAVGCRGSLRVYI